MTWPAWLPRPLPLALWLITRTALVALVGTFYPWEWYADLLYEWVLTMTAGGNPYLGGQAYPPLSMLMFLIPGAVSPSHAAFRVAYALFIVAIDLGVLLWMRRAERDGFRHAALAYAIALPAIGPVLLLWRFDLLPILCQVAATVCAVQATAHPDRPALRLWSWAWLGVGIALKLYLLALVPLWLAWELWSRRGAEEPSRGKPWDVFRGLTRRELRAFAGRAASGLALALGPVMIIAAVALAVWGTRTLEPYTYSFGRAITIDSTAALVIAELGASGLAQVEWTYAPDCFCPVRSAGPAIDTALRTASSLLGITGVLGFALWYALRPGPLRFVAAAAGITAVLVFASPLLSPQHLVWPLAPLALIAGTARGRVALGLAMLAAATAAYSMWGPTFQVHVVAYTDLGRALLYIRVLTELGAILALVWPTGLKLNEARAVRLPSARTA